MYTGGGGGGRGCVGKTAPDVLSRRRGSYSRPRAQFFFFTIRTYLDRYVYFFLSPGIAGVNLEKETGKKSIMLTKYHVDLLKTSSCGCKILFFTLPILV